MIESCKWPTKQSAGLEQVGDSVFVVKYHLIWCDWDDLYLKRWWIHTAVSVLQWTVNLNGRLPTAEENCIWQAPTMMLGQQRLPLHYLHEQTLTEQALELPCTAETQAADLRILQDLFISLAFRTIDIHTIHYLRGHKLRDQKSLDHIRGHCNIKILFL